MKKMFTLACGLVVVLGLGAVPALAVDPVLTIPDTMNPIGIANTMMTTVAPYVTALLILSFIIGLIVVVKKMIKRGATRAVAR